ncbi:hypothetical protein NL108_002941 [Boleophthalmus pectinirostris]|uniref:transmembrane protein 271-like n=1 Tax=Boleophthalmus pectinirostris TaxID=150288 RepID=UPI00242C320D|nr:transmembrane protein 271-like [Boleophthalmus pectinirostris]KAJ0049749.1 hypothetical protein NL108_002941 [Boleophthalmus pectinirostris]
MKWSTRGACALLSSALLFACALSEVAVGLRCVSLGSAVKTHFRLSGAAGAFYSGLLVGGGQVLLGLALLCCSARAPGCRNLALLAVVVLLLGVLSAFSGAVLDGDAATLARRKYSHFCFHVGPENPACARLREYQRSLVLSAVLCALQCVLGLLNLLVIKRYKAAQFSRRQLARRLARQSTQLALFAEERDARAELPHVSYINLAVTVLEEPPGAESTRSAHPSRELPGYAPADHYSLPFSTAPPSDLPPAYEDIFPAPPQEALCAGAAPRCAGHVRRHRDTL